MTPPSLSQKKLRWVWIFAVWPLKIWLS